MPGFGVLQFRLRLIRELTGPDHHTLLAGNRVHPRVDAVEDSFRATDWFKSIDTPHPLPLRHQSTHVLNSTLNNYPTNQPEHAEGALCNQS